MITHSPSCLPIVTHIISLVCATVFPFFFNKIASPICKNIELTSFSILFFKFGNIALFYLMMVSSCSLEKRELSPAFELYLKEEQAADSFEDIIWTDQSGNYLLQTVSHRSGYATSPRVRWLSFRKILNPRDTLTYYFFDTGVSFEIKNSSIFVLSKNRQRSFEGWYQKENDHMFYPVLSEDVANKPYVLEDEMLFTEKEQGHLRPVKKVFAGPGLPGRSILDSLDYFTNGVFVWNGAELKLASLNAGDIVRLGAGQYYIPQPGSALKHKISLNELMFQLNAVRDVKGAPSKLIIPISMPNSLRSSSKQTPGGK